MEPIRTPYGVAPEPPAAPPAPWELAGELEHLADELGRLTALVDELRRRVSALERRETPATVTP